MEEPKFPIEETKFIADKCAEVNHLCEDSKTSEGLQIKLYKKRWLNLIVFTSFSIISDAQSIQFTIILNIVKKYFNVSSLAIKLSATMYSILYIPMFIPLAYATHRWNVRPVCVLAATSMCIGAWIKYASMNPKGYALLMIGQGLVGAWQSVIMTMPAALAARWFGPDEVATATAIGCSGILLGQAVTSVVTPVVVKERPGDGTGDDLRKLQMVLAILSTAVAASVIIFLKNDPKLPPSKSRALQKLEQKQEFALFPTLHQLIKNKDYVLFWNIHGILCSTVVVINVTLNTLYLIHFEHEEEEVGRLGLLLILSGSVGLIISGKILDKTKQFKLVTVGLCIGTIISLIGLTASLHLQSKWAVHISISFFGAFAIAFLLISLENCAEITYPLPESFCAIILNLSPQIYATVITIITDKIILVYGDVGVELFLVILLIVGLILALATKDQRKRQNASKINQTLVCINTNLKN